MTLGFYIKALKKPLPLDQRIDLDPEMEEEGIYTSERIIREKFEDIRGEMIYQKDPSNEEYWATCEGYSNSVKVKDFLEFESISKELYDALEDNSNDYDQRRLTPITCRLVSVLNDLSLEQFKETKYYEWVRWMKTSIPLAYSFLGDKCIQNPDVVHEKSFGAVILRT